MKLFISYRHIEPDRSFCERLAIHLATSAEIRYWDDRGIELGDAWRREIEQAIETADIGVVMVSADLLGSSFVQNVELPMLLDAHREGRLRLIPIYVGPTGVVPAGIKGLQGPNAPARPLSALTRAQREAIYADFAKRLHEYAEADRLSGRPDDRRPGQSDISLESPPASGLLFDRTEIQRQITGFLSRPHQRICVVQGFHGVGKTTLAAKIVADHRERFVDVFWATSRSSERSGLVLLARLDAFLRRNHDLSLRPFIQHLAEPEVDLEAAVAHAVDALTRAPYLLVFDDFHGYLDSANALVDEVIRRLLGGLSRAPGGTKILLLSNRRPALEQGFDLFPTGTALEQELLGLPADAVGELLVESGVAVADVALLRQIGDRFSGNPAMIKVYAALVARQHRDPIEALESAGIRAPVAAFVGATVADLEPTGRDALEGLAVFREPLNWDQLGQFGFMTDDVVALLDRWLVTLDPASHKITMPPMIRQFVLDSTPPLRLIAAHLGAAAGYERVERPAEPRSYDDVRPLLEAGHHKVDAGVTEAGATAILEATDFLVQWGYGDLASDEVEFVRARTDVPAVVARCHLQSGRIHDQRGLLENAERSYEAAAALARLGGHDQTLADALYLLGRIHNARNDFVAAQRYLADCLAVCDTAGLGRPQAAAKLALAWGRKEQGAPIGDVVSAFEEALALAASQGDHSTLSDAHRQIGFISWVHFHDRVASERHYEEAERIATRYSLVKETGAIHKELAYLATEWGELDVAEEHSRSAMEAAEGLRDQYLMPGARTNEAHTLERRGDLDGAERLFERSAKEFAENGNPGGEAYALHELARLEAGRGRHEKALEHLARARELSVEHGLTLQHRAIEVTARKIGG